MHTRSPEGHSIAIDRQKVDKPTTNMSTVELTQAVSAIMPEDIQLDIKNTKYWILMLYLLLLNSLIVFSS